jgi:hypothetical protein
MAADDFTPTPLPSAPTLPVCMEVYYDSEQPDYMFEWTKSLENFPLDVSFIRAEFNSRFS